MAYFNKSFKLIQLRHSLLFCDIKKYCSFSKKDYKKCYALLDISENSNQEHIRKAFIKLAKKYHPDSGTEFANAEKFNEIETAFRILKTKKPEENYDNDEIEKQVDEFDIKHTAPQHRQYLSFGGVGAGTPFQRQKQYTKYKAMQAVDNVLEHRLNKNTAIPEDKVVFDKEQSRYKHKIKTKYGFDRLVEDLIQEAMSRGEFNNLSGTGKPLASHQNINPYVDFVTHKLNQVLIENGFTPEWITLQKEIREDIQTLKDSLYLERSYLGPDPLKPEELNTWNGILEKHEKFVSNTNKKISKFNLLVPVLQKQMILIRINQLGTKILKEGKNNLQVKHSKPAPVNRPQSVDNTSGIFDIIYSIFSHR